MQRIKSEKTMKPNFENILSLVQKGTSVEFNPEILSFNNVRRIVQEAASHTSCKVTLRNTDAFSPDNWVLLAEEAKGQTLGCGLRLKPFAFLTLIDGNLAVIAVDNLELDN